MTVSSAVPEIPASDVAQSARYYVDKLGFTFDWHSQEHQIAGVSRGDCRLFITSDEFRERFGNKAPLVFWINLDSSAEVDELYAEWKGRGAKLLSEPEDKPYNLHEFFAADLDGNIIRVFFDIGTKVVRDPQN